MGKSLNPRHELWTPMLWNGSARERRFVGCQKVGGHSFRGEIGSHVRMSFRVHPALAEQRGSPGGTDGLDKLRQIAWRREVPILAGRNIIRDSADVGGDHGHTGAGP